MMGDILKTNEKILKGVLYLNILFLIFSFFYFSKGSVILFYVMNIILLGVYLIIRKNYILFQGLSATNKLFKKLNDMGSSE